MLKCSLKCGTSHIDISYFFQILYLIMKGHIMLRAGNVNQTRVNGTKHKNTLARFLSSDPLIGGVIVVALVITLTIMSFFTFEMVRHYNKQQASNYTINNLQILKTVDPMMISTMNLSDKIDYLKKIAKKNDLQVITEYGEVNLVMNFSQDQCETFLGQLNNYISYDGYALFVNGSYQQFSQTTPVNRYMQEAMCKPDNTIMRKYFIVDNDIVDFSGAHKPVTQNDDNANQAPAIQPAQDTQESNENDDNSNGITQINNNSNGYSQTITITNNGSNVVITNTVGSAQEDDSTDSNDDSNSATDTTPPPCFPGEKVKK